MDWALSILLGWMPDLWIIAALGAAALWVFAWFQPSRIAAEVVRVGVAVLLGLAVYLWTYATATTAYEARVAADREAERQRVERISAATASEARLEATLARAAVDKAEMELAAALAALPPEPMPPTQGYSGGLSPASAAALDKIMRR